MRRDALAVLPTVLTLVTAVLELGVVVVLVPNNDGDATDADERLVGLIGGGDRQRELPVALAVKARRGGDHTCREEVCIEGGEGGAHWRLLTSSSWKLTGVGADIKTRRHAVPVHDAVLDFPVDAHVSVVGMDAQDEGSRWLVLQDDGVLTVVHTLRAKTVQSEPGRGHGRTRQESAFW